MIAPLIDELAAEYGSKIKAVSFFFFFEDSGGGVFSSSWSAGALFSTCSLSPSFFFFPSFLDPTTKQYKLNTDESPGVATEYGIRSM